MDIHEFQAKKILQKYGVPLPPFAVAFSKEQAVAAVEHLHLDQGVVKVQVHAGGRGKAGGVKVGKSRQEIIDHAGKLIGMRIVNNQTGKQGIVANSVLISPLVEIAKEYYLGAVIDRKLGKAMLILSPEGGMDIEEVAVKHPEKILSVPIPPDGKFKGFVLYRICKFMGWTGETAEQGKALVQAVAKAFHEVDATLLEINPLVLTNAGELLAVDAKLSIDDNALFRQPEIASFYDPTQINPAEVRAKEQDLSYITLEGNVGCMVNGAGLAMATMDIIQHYGGKPANFLDVGGGANEEKVAEGFKIILSDPHVKAILVNIFGGIMNCVTLAAGIISAASEQAITVPLIVRMEGTNVEQGKKMLSAAGLNIRIANDLSEAAQLVVAATKGV